MTSILITILNMSIAASMAAIAVILVRIPLKKTPKIFSYILWAAVFLRFICPVSFESPASLMPTNAQVIPQTIITAPTPQINSGISAVDARVNLIIENALLQADPAVSANAVRIALLSGGYVWLLGLIGLMLYAAFGYARVKRKVYDATLVDGTIFETDKIATAFVLGFIRPKIFMPTTIKGVQLNYILKHEKVHIRRRDYLIRLLAFFILAVHWFNPIAWVSYYLMSKDMEMSCDEAVIRKSSADIRHAYSLSLVNMYTRKPGLLSPLAFGEGSFRNMKARIKNVLSFKKTPRWVIVICSLLSVLFMAGFTTYPPQSLTFDLPNTSQNIDTPAGTNVQIKTAAIMDTEWFLVASEPELRAIGQSELYPLSGRYMLNNDITLSKDTDWKPIGTREAPFTGIFNGNGYEIIDLTITDKNTNPIGMFAYCSGAQIYNVTLRGLDYMSAFQKGDSIAPVVVFGMNNTQTYDIMIVDVAE